MKTPRTQIPPLTVAQALRNIAAEAIERKKKAALVEKTASRKADDNPSSL